MADGHVFDFVLGFAKKPYVLLVGLVRLIGGFSGRNSGLGKVSIEEGGDVVENDHLRTHLPQPRLTRP